MLTYYNQIADYYFEMFSEPNLTLFFSNPSINSIDDLNKSSMENRVKWENIGKTFSKILKLTSVRRKKIWANPARHRQAGPGSQLWLINCMQET